MKLRLLKSYMVHSAGVEVDFPPAIGELLIKRKIAEAIGETESKAESPKANKSQSLRKPHRNK